jgi:hypothetical protein
LRLQHGRAQRKRRRAEERRSHPDTPTEHRKAIAAIAHAKTNAVAIEVAIDPGRHVLRIRSGRYCSPDRAFDAGDVAEFRCHGALFWPLWLASFAIPNLAITLKRQ